MMRIDFFAIVILSVNVHDEKDRRVAGLNHGSQTYHILFVKYGLKSTTLPRGL